MASELAKLEQFFRESLLAVPEVVECVGGKCFNTFAPPTPAFPYAVFQVVPLQDNFGQARTSIQSRFFIDLKFYDDLPLAATVDAAVFAVKEYFRTAPRTFQFEEWRISIRHERPINLPTSGTRPDEQIITRGSTYAVWMSKG